MQEDKIEKIDDSIFEAKRFIHNAIKWKGRLNSDIIYSSSKEGGAARRSSLDLTRALAKLRKP